MVQENLDQILQNLAHVAQCAPPRSRAQRKALAQLIEILLASKRLARPKAGKFRGFYGDIYEDALQRLFAYICERIYNYNPNRGSFLGWVNFLLQRRFFIEASRDYMHPFPKSVNAPSISELRWNNLDSISSEELISSNSNSETLLDDLRQYIEEDPEGIFQSRHVQGHPDVHFQKISLMRLDGYKWEELSEKMGVSATSLSSFYQRSLSKFTPHLREMLM
ncbi:sigma-70 family RNA polymerase sigma factor [Leptothoe spongobia]|uniref:sigma-70 family RNA polymerase sigma factor n=1 Tax=Leptothoe spongobia TaxID=2651728 RepID=UPI001C02B87C|nr:sigma-70 family RNA polymerase sigma factor [Leptothoe spongobia]